MSSGYSGSSGLSEVIVSAMSMQQLSVDQSYVKGACPPPPPPPPPVKSVPLQQSSQDVLVEGTTSAPQLKTLVEELQSVQLRKVNTPRIYPYHNLCNIVPLYIPAATVTVLLLQCQLYM